MVVNQETLQGNWDEIRAAIKQKWGQCSEQELLEARGSLDQLIGLIQSKTGEGRDAILQYFDQLTLGDGSAAAKMAENLRGQADRARASAQAASAQVSGAMREGYLQAEQLVRQRPAESLAVCFGAGLITGVIVGVLLRGR